MYEIEISLGELKSACLRYLREARSVGHGPLREGTGGLKALERTPYLQNVDGELSIFPPVNWFANMSKMQWLAAGSQYGPLLLLNPCLIPA
jgi:hypothetical protein